MKVPYRYISADSHLEIPPDRWRDRLPEKHRDRAPRLIRLANGGDAWLVENRPLYQGGPNLCAGKPYEEWNARGMTYEDAAGTGPPDQRLWEQDKDCIDAEVLFSGVGGRQTWNGIADTEAYEAVIRAYNEFLAEDYCGAAPDRLIGVGIIPERGIDMAVAELERCKRLGFKGVNLNRFPSGRVQPSAEDARFWVAALDLEMPVTIHTALADDDGGRGGRDRAGGPADPAIAVARCSSAYAIRGGPAVIMMAIAGVFVRFPSLQIYLAENQIGWVPNCMEQTDILYLRHHVWQAKHRGFKPLPELPSYYLKNNVVWGFFDNPIGVKLRHHIGVDHILWSSDFPHAPTDWPNSLSVIDRNFAGVPENEKYAMVAGNCMRFFHLEPTFETTEEREQRVAERRSAALSTVV